jgi:hypothetical protein
MYNSIFKSKTQQELAYNDLVATNSEILFIGTSHFYSSIDPDYIDINITTLSAGSLNYLYQLEILKNALKINEKIKNVFIEIDYIPLLINTLDNRVRRFESDFTDLFQLGLNYEKLPGLTYSKYVIFKLKSLFGLDMLVDAPAFNLKEIVFFKNNNLTTKKRAGFTNNNKTYDSIDQERVPKASSIYDQIQINTNALIEIIHLCKNKNINITYIKFPRYKSINDYQKYITDLITQHDTQYFELFNLDHTISFEITDFKDNNHLNLSGARKYSIALNNFLNDNKY